MLASIFLIFSTTMVATLASPELAALGLNANEAKPSSYYRGGRQAGYPYSNSYSSGAYGYPGYQQGYSTNYQGYRNPYYAQQSFGYSPNYYQSGVFRGQQQYSNNYNYNPGYNTHQSAGYYNNGFGFGSGGGYPSQSYGVIPTPVRGGYAK